MEPAKNEYRVIGPPGTGKTQFLRALVEKWTLTDGLYDPSDFLLASFTRTAAAVLKGRVSVPKENVATLHAFGWRLLGRPKVAEVPPLVNEWNERVKAGKYPPSWLIAPLPQPEDVWADELEGAFAQYTRWRALGSPPYHPLAATVATFAAEWEDFKRSTNSVDFLDMIEYPLRERLRPPINARVLIIDEAQDLLPLQWALVRWWAQHCERFVVAGDPAQAIYSWLGATPDPLLSPLPADRVRVLSRSYRLPEVVYQVAESWLRYHRPSLVNGRVYQPRSDTGCVRYVHRSLDDFQLLLPDIERQLGQGRTVMILASCGYMLAPVTATLREAGIPFHNPYRPDWPAWNPLKPSREGVVSTVSRFLAFKRPDPVTWGDDAREWTSEDINAFLPMLRAEVFAARGLKERIPSILEHASDPPEAFLAALAPDHEAEARGCSHHWLLQFALAQYKPQLEYCVRVCDRLGGEALRHTPSVIVGTIHSVKGGEADVVYLAPDISPRALTTGLLSGWNDQIRLFYVGFTRARQELVILQPRRARLSIFTYIPMEVKHGPF